MSPFALQQSFMQCLQALKIFGNGEAGMRDVDHRKVKPFSRSRHGNSISSQIFSGGRHGCSFDDRRQP